MTQYVTSSVTVLEAAMFCKIGRLYDEVFIENQKKRTDGDIINFYLSFHLNDVRGVNFSIFSTKVITLLRYITCILLR